MLVLITGASAGFGAAIARRYVAEGHRVVLTGRRAERLNALAQSLAPHAHVEVFDVRDADAVATLPERLPEGWREIDVLVNNAGLALGLELGPAAAWAVLLFVPEVWGRTRLVRVTDVTGGRHCQQQACSALRRLAWVPNLIRAS